MRQCPPTYVDLPELHRRTVTDVGGHRVIELKPPQPRGFVGSNPTPGTPSDLCIYSERGSRRRSGGLPSLICSLTSICLSSDCPSLTQCPSLARMGSVLGPASPGPRQSTSPRRSERVWVQLALSDWPGHAASTRSLIRDAPTRSAPSTPHRLPGPRSVSDRILTPWRYGGWP
jgi:hypothetical protein